MPLVDIQLDDTADSAGPWGVSPVQQNPGAQFTFEEIQELAHLHSLVTQLGKILLLASAGFLGQ